jgi:hypothetical protein
MLLAYAKGAVGIIIASTAPPPAATALTPQLRRLRYNGIP